VSHAITVRHNFETAHRLPHLGGKCRNLHGHSWVATVSVAANNLSGDGTVVEFGRFKSCLRGWIDTHLDHGTMLGHRDPLVRPIEDDGGKLVVFGRGPRAGEQRPLPVGDVDAELPELVEHLEWPTVENVAVLLQRVAERCLATLPGVRAIGAHVDGVHVTETAVNAAIWKAQVTT
jgi:6-pyruvoyltetrahydropterin/6-carboxytetrahydropterin synthase